PCLLLGHARPPTLRSENDSSCHGYHRRREQVLGCLHTRVEPGWRWSTKAVVCFYAGATACFVGALWGVPKCRDVGRVHRRRHSSYLVVFSHIAHHTHPAQSRGLHLESRALCPGCWLDLEGFDGPLAAEGRN
ncbi:unnamed protein product, partial [Ectocarpus fasciculatus]